MYTLNNGMEKLAESHYAELLKYAEEGRRFHIDRKPKKPARSRSSIFYLIKKRPCNDSA